MDAKLTEATAVDLSSSYELAKRACDIALAVLLLICLAPVMLAIAVAIRLTSPGPALYRQERIGRRGRAFRIWKFRTMRCEERASQPLITSADDDRVTPLGRVLRRAKLDEFPQLVNVLLGQMSFVGPRPQVRRFVERFPDRYRELILTVPPGITGPTQLEFRQEEQMLAGVSDREAYYIRELLPLKCRLDAEYVTQHSLRYDARLALETLRVFLRGNGKRVGRRVGAIAVVRSRSDCAGREDA